MERTEGQLCTRLTDGLSSDHTDSLTLLNHLAGSEVTAVTLHADTMLALAGEHRTNLHTLNGRVFDGLCDRLCDLLTGSDNKLTCGGMDDVVYRHTTKDAL